MAVQTAKNITNTMAADVVVIGAGPAGLSAGLSAAELGNSVIILEKSEKPGGNLLLSPGTISTDELRGLSRNDKTEELNVESQSCHSNGISLDGLYNRNIASTLGWLSKLGVVLFPIKGNISSDSPCTDVALPGPCGYLPQILRALIRKQVRVFTDARVIGLSKTNDRVSGVEVDFIYQGRELDPDRDVLKIKANRGVVIASGDFSGNRSLKSQLLDSSSAYVSGMNSQNTGDGHMMARQVGGIVRNPHLTWWPELRFSLSVEADSSNYQSRWLKSRFLLKFGLTCFSSTRLQRIMARSLVHAMAPSLSAVSYGAILVDDSGQKVNDISADGLGGDKEDSQYWLVFDDLIGSRIDQDRVSVCHISSIMGLTIKEARKISVPFLRYFESMESLGTGISVNLQNLNESLSSSEQAGSDDTAGKGFYAMGPLENRIVSTEGGLAVSSKMEVLDKHGQPIKGLYAAGSTGLGSLVLPRYGYHLGWAFVSGREAGKWASEGRTGINQSERIDSMK